MNIKELQASLQNLTNSKITLTEIAKALGKDLANISAKAKRGTEIKYSEILTIEKYFNVKLTNVGISLMPQKGLTPDLSTPASFKNIGVYKEIEKIHNDMIFSEYEKLYNSIITLDYIHLSHSCENDINYDIESTPIILGTALIKKLFKVSQPQNLKIFRACGDSMEHTIYDEDLLLVNTEINEYKSSGIYIIIINNKVFCKRLNLLINGDLEIISDNKKYGHEIISKDHEMNIEIKIIGRVIKNLSRGL